MTFYIADISPLFAGWEEHFFFRMFLPIYRFLHIDLAENFLRFGGLNMFFFFFQWHVLAIRRGDLKRWMFYPDGTSPDTHTELFFLIFGDTLW